MITLLSLTGTASAIHPDRALQIQTIHEMQPLWKAGPSERFASDPPGASSVLLGVKGDWSEIVNGASDRGEMERSLHDPAVDIPASFDSATNWPKCAATINNIRDQSNCGCCWAFAGAEAGSDRMCIATDGRLLVPLSAQDVCFNSNLDGCDGGQIDTPWTFMTHHGAVSGGQYNGTGVFGRGFCSAFSLPHCHHHGPQGNDPYPSEGKQGCPSEKSPKGPTECDSDSAGDHTNYATDKYSFNGTVITAAGEKAIQQAIMLGGPVETAFSVYEDFENYVSGIYYHVTGALLGGHAVRFVGWGEENGTKYWRVANSWNPFWGEDGYFRIRRGTNECGIEGECYEMIVLTTIKYLYYPKPTYINFSSTLVFLLFPIEGGITGSSPDAIWTKGKNPRPGPEPKACYTLKAEADCLSPKEYGSCQWCSFGSNVFGCFSKGESVPGSNCTGAEYR